MFNENCVKPTERTNNMQCIFIRLQFMIESENLAINSTKCAKEKTNDMHYMCHINGVWTKRYDMLMPAYLYKISQLNW